MATALKIVPAILVIHLLELIEMVMNLQWILLKVLTVFTWLTCPTVQNEHVVLFDNTSIFGDIIYESVTGYKQNRIPL